MMIILWKATKIDLLILHDLHVFSQKSRGFERLLASRAEMVVHGRDKVGGRFLGLFPREVFEILLRLVGHDFSRLGLLKKTGRSLNIESWTEKKI